MTNSDQLQEVFAVMILNSLDAISRQGLLTIKTAYYEPMDVIEVVFSDTGTGIKPDDLKRM